MKKFLHCAMVVAIAVLVAGLSTTIASAARLSLSANTWRTAITAMEFESETGTLRIRCPVTMSGSFVARTFAKTTERSIGSLTNVTVAEAACTGEGRVSVEASSLPTETRYESFAGTLPNITAVRFNQPPPRLINRYATLTCTYAPGVGDTRTIEQQREAGGNLVTIRWIWRIPGIGTNSIFCPGFLVINGMGAPRSAEGATIRMTLI
jgi:hypothetical protein